jgi:hypothetical protein
MMDFWVCQRQQKKTSKQKHADHKENGHLQSFTMPFNRKVSIISLFLSKFCGVSSFVREVSFGRSDKARRRTLFSEPTDSNFGRRDYWNQVYKKETTFSWYAGWDDIQPFCDDFFEKDYRVLIPGVGNDAALVDMYDDGYVYLTAMDYAPEGIERCREMLGNYGSTGQKRFL